ncbi:MAG: DUF1553 domain-containing protein [Balneolaceae bacterium]|nr:MAG: DUF1553 domain-containing protein [Balneolaceae bacterium]
MVSEYPRFFSVSRCIVLAGIVIIFAFGGCRSDSIRLAEGEEPLPDIVDFNQHIRGVLSDTCFACHGPDAMAREAGLRLDTPEGAFAPLESDSRKYAIIPGNPNASEVFRRIISDDPDYVMPTPTSNLSLTNRQIALIKRWIEQGAEYKPHWAFIPPQRPEVPKVKNRDWAENEIDKFILEKIEKAGVQPSSRAARETLLRRVSFDLTGLPPTIQELDRFLADESADAYENAVDRLLASHSYGERLANEWLDVARYADTHGYQDDGANDMWPWREWVIHAFNRNMPFDEFAVWQIAGDLLPNPTHEQRLATGFGRVHQQSQEGGIIGEEYRVEYVADRVMTTGTAFLGMTMQCARCHDHKYDPVSEKEYYEFAAFFDNINDIGQIPNKGAAGPTILLHDDETEKLIGYLKNRISAAERDLENQKAYKRNDFRDWLQQPGLREKFNTQTKGLYASMDLNTIRGDSAIIVQVKDSVLTGSISGSLKLVEGVNGNAIEFSHGNAVNLPRRFAQFERNDSFSLSFWVYPPESIGEVPMLVKKGMIFIGHPGYDVFLFDHRVSMRLVHGWPFNAIQVLTEEPLTPGEWSHITVTYNGSSRADGIEIFINGEIQTVHVEHDTLFKNIMIPSDEPRYGYQDFLLGHRQSFEQLRYDGMRLDEIRIFERRLSEAEALILSGKRAELDQLLALNSNELTRGQENILFSHYLLHAAPDIDAVKEDLRNYRVELSSVKDTLPEVMVMEERLNRRTSYIRERGMYDQLGEVVYPGVPSSIMEFPDEFPQNRLGLARWIMHDDNPLTARVLVNRYWQMIFGNGLVDTPDDFGNQGSIPSHPELLDWLAVEFRESGWDLKHLLKTMVMSATYRQSSVMTPQMRELDPNNRLLARGPRYRLPAEMIRDNALLASGLLVDKIGGPSVFPYQPEGLWEETTSGRHLTTYYQDSGDNLYRRSIYTFWKRTVPPPGMTTFDAAMRTHPTVQREHTSTPLQALHTLNDPIYIESSRLLAERMLREGGESLDEQIIFAFRAAVSRKPNRQELDILRELFEEEYQTYKDDPGLAEQLLKVGEFPADKQLSPVDVAARTILTNAIFNLDETITKL